MDVSRLSKLFEAGNSGVKKFTKTLSVVVDKSHKDNWSLGAALFLNSKLQQYMEGSDGVLLGYEGLKVKSTPSEPDADVDLHHVTIEVQLYVFCPNIGKCLSGRVVAKKKSNIVVAVHEYFNVNCISPKNIKKLEVGGQVSVKISSVVYVNGRPSMMGELDKAESTTTLTSPSTSASVNGLSSPVKRKSEAQEKPKKKAKIAAKSQENGGTTTDESDDEEQTSPILKAPKTPAKTPKKSEAQDKPKKKTKKAFESQSQDDEETTTAEEEQSPSQSTAPKVPKTPGKNPKVQKTIPDGFKSVEKTRPNGRVDREYIGPDGKNYRSIPEIYKKNPELCPSESSDPQEKLTMEEMKEKVEEVVTNWNKGEDGSMNKNKNKFYSSVGLKKLSKTDRHFTDAKSKKEKLSNEVEDKIDTEEDEEEADQASSSTSLEVGNGNKGSVTISDANDIKKKKKKKKNKENNDKTI